MPYIFVHVCTAKVLRTSGLDADFAQTEDVRPSNAANAVVPGNGSGSSGSKDRMCTLFVLCTLLTCAQPMPNGQVDGYDMMDTCSFR